MSEDGARVRAFDLNAGITTNAALRWIEAAARDMAMAWLLRDMSVPLGDVRLAACARDATCCVGSNSQAHATEMAASVFRDNVRQIDYEVELCIVIGKGWRDITRE